MPNPQVDEYIKKARKGGMGDEEIKSELLKSGWSKADVDQSFNPKAAPPQTPPPAGSAAPPSPSGAAAPPPVTAQSSDSSNTGMAILAYLGILIVVPFFTDAKNDPFVKFHLKQGLALIVAWFVVVILMFIPFINFLSLVLWIVWLVFMIIGIINAATGKMKELPLIGGMAKMFKF